MKGSAEERVCVSHGHRRSVGMAYGKAEGEGGVEVGKGGGAEMRTLVMCKQ